MTDGARILVYDIMLDSIHEDTMLGRQMIKERLMKALKKAAEDFNGGMGASAAVAKAAEEADFNEKQAERLVEMFNTAAAINQEKSASDPTGTCELADKSEVQNILVRNCGQCKAASAKEPDYSFYGSTPVRTNPSIEARASGISSMCKAASAEPETIPAELNVSQRSLYKIIEGKIDMLKSAAAAADDVARALRLEIESESIKVAKEIESPFAPAEMADMFKAACSHLKAVGGIAEYSTKVAESDGGRFAKMNVFDSSQVDHILKTAAEIEANIDAVAGYEEKRDFYLKAAADAEASVRAAVGLGKEDGTHGGLADMFTGSFKIAASEPDADTGDEKEDAACEASLCVKIAQMLKESGASSESVARLAEELEKDAAIGMVGTVQVPTVADASSAFTHFKGVDSERRRVRNVRMAMLLADLMENDPIIRDADPDTVTEAYKTMVMTAPRVALDKAQARAFLRSAVNSVAISPSDAKVLADVDKGVSRANIDLLTSRDSSIKDSNE